jgi:cysteine-rich repeat protein
MMAPRSPLVVGLLLGSAFLDAAGVADAYDEPLAGTKLKLRSVSSASGTRHESLTLSLRGPSLLPAGTDAPNLVGVILQIHAASGETADLSLPPCGWSSFVGGYKFKNRNLPTPVQSAVITTKIVKLKARSVGISLDEASQGAIDVALLSGAPRYCALFGGTVLRDAPGYFFAKNTPRPFACAASTTVGASCGNGVLDADGCEQCDDGANVPLDGCSADCKTEQPTAVVSSSDATYRSAFATSSDFETVLDVAAAQGFDPTLLAAIASSEGNGPTAYAAKLAAQGNRAGLILSRRDLPSGSGSMFVYQVGNRELWIELPVGTLRLTYPQPNLGGTPVLDVLAPDGSVVTPSAQSLAAGASVCEQARVDQLQCIADEMTSFDKVTECAEAAATVLQCLATIASPISPASALTCAGAFLALLRCIHTSCPSIDGLPCATEQCTRGHCLPSDNRTRGIRCAENSPPQPLCDKEAHETCNPATGTCEEFRVTGIDPEPVVTQANYDGTITPDEMADISIAYSGSPRFPVSATIAAWQMPALNCCPGSGPPCNDCICNACGGSWYGCGGDAPKLFSTPMNPLAWSAVPELVCNAVSVGAMFLEQITLKDANGVETDPHCFVWDCQPSLCGPMMCPGQ